MLKNGMNFENLTHYTDFLNNNANKSLLNRYNEIINYDFIHFIPAVRFDSALFLRTLSLLKQPENVLEIGFGSGVSTYFIWEPITKGKKITTIEKDEKRFVRGLNVIKNFGMTDINLVHGDIFEYLDKNTSEKYDYIFIDAAKKDYQNYLNKVENKLNIGGFLICDNNFFNGKVICDDVDIPKSHIKPAKAMREFNIFLGDNNNFETTFFNIGDGMSLSIKIKE